MFKHYFLVFILASLFTQAKAQNDTLSISTSTTDSSATEEVINELPDAINVVDAEVQVRRRDTIPHSPRKAALLSAVLPGAGQIYNKKYWKAPIVWGGMGFSLYNVFSNNKNYHKFRDAYLIRIDDDPNTTDNYVDIYTDDQLLTIQDGYRRNRDLSYLSLGVIYVLNIVDASVDGHLYSFDVGDDLSFNLRPYIDYTIQPTTGLTLSLKL